ARADPPPDEVQERVNGPPARCPTTDLEAAPPPRRSVSPVSSHTYGTPCWTPTSTAETLLHRPTDPPPARTHPPPTRRAPPHRPAAPAPSTETATPTAPGPVRTGRTALPPPPPVRTTAPSGTIPMVHDPTGHRHSTPKATTTTTPPVIRTTTAPDVATTTRAA